MNKEEKRKLFIDYIQERKISMRKFSKEIGYHETVLSKFKTGTDEIPSWLCWGLQQGMKVIKLQEKLAK